MFPLFCIAHLLLRIILQHQSLQVLTYWPLSITVVIPFSVDNWLEGKTNHFMGCGSTQLHHSYRVHIAFSLVLQIFKQKWDCSLSTSTVAPLFTCNRETKDILRRKKSWIIEVILFICKWHETLHLEPQRSTRWWHRSPISLHYLWDQAIDPSPKWRQWIWMS